jgi:hypothetical protein
MVLNVYWDSNPKEPLSFESFDAARRLIERLHPGAVYGNRIPEAAEPSSDAQGISVYANRQDMVDLKRLALIKELP